jgi:GntR family transcriptional regulator
MAPRNPTLAAYRTLHDAVTSQRWDIGAKLPSERTLAAELGVSRTTVRQALTELADAGLIEAAPQRGWFVVGNRISEGQNVLRSFTSFALERRLTPGARIIDSRVRSATLDESTHLQLPPGVAILALERVRTLDGFPVCREQSTLALPRMPGLEDIDLTDASLFDILSAEFGIDAVRCDYAVQAEAADEITADLLNLTVGAPVLVGHETTVDQKDRPISCGSVTYRGDAYRFTASLFRAPRMDS